MLKSDALQDRGACGWQGVATEAVLLTGSCAPDRKMRAQRHGRGCTELPAYQNWGPDVDEYFLSLSQARQRRVPASQASLLT